MPKELLVPGSVVFIPPTALRRGGSITQWWRYVAGAEWRQPEGAGSTIAGRENHPVVHITYDDALAYARWRGRSLPTEAQWEYAARGGRDGEDDLSSAFDADGKPIANTWQGIFPVYNTNEDGHAGTAPVGCFKPNGYGLYDMIGNVWEWTSDWYRAGHPREAVSNPTGPDLREIVLAPGQPQSRVIKGGSYLCASNFCARYRPAARHPQEADIGAAHLGFRTVLRKPNDVEFARALNVSTFRNIACDRPPVRAVLETSPGHGVSGPHHPDGLASNTSQWLYLGTILGADAKRSLIFLV